MTDLMGLDTNELHEIEGIILPIFLIYQIDENIYHINL
jgi:hypothetical protein